MYPPLWDTCTPNHVHTVPVSVPRRLNELNQTAAGTLASTYQWQNSFFFFFFFLLVSGSFNILKKKIQTLEPFFVNAGAGRDLSYNIGPAYAKETDRAVSHKDEDDDADQRRPLQVKIKLRILTLSSPGISTTSVVTSSKSSFERLLAFETVLARGWNPSPRPTSSDDETFNIGLGGREADDEERRLLPCDAILAWIELSLFTWTEQRQSDGAIHIRWTSRSSCEAQKSTCCKHCSRAGGRRRRLQCSLQHEGPVKTTTSTRPSAISMISSRTCARELSIKCRVISTWLRWWKLQYSTWQSESRLSTWRLTEVFEFADILAGFSLQPSRCHVQTWAQFYYPGQKNRQARKPNKGACMLDRSRACVTCACQ